MNKTKNRASEEISLNSSSDLKSGYPWMNDYVTRRIRREDINALSVFTM